MTRKRIITLVLALLVAGIAWLEQQPSTGDTVRRPTNGSPASEPAAVSSIDRAFASQRSDVLVTDTGHVVRILQDDNKGSRHQRFVVELASGLSVLIAHNIDLAPRVASLALDDRVRFRGEYEWNDRGGVVHWTHHDPDGTHPGGWIEHAGQLFE